MKYSKVIEICKKTTQMQLEEAFSGQTEDNMNVRINNDRKGL